VTVAVVARDLMIATRIADAGARAGVEVRRFDDPSQLPAAAAVRPLLVDWDARGPDWGERLSKWCRNAPVSVRPRGGPVRATRRFGIKLSDELSDLDWGANGGDSALAPS
jgi:hypothetical protein